MRLYHLPGTRSTRVGRLRSAGGGQKVRQKFVAFLDDMTEREPRSGIPGQATRCEDVTQSRASTRLTLDRASGLGFTGFVVRDARGA